MKNLSDCIARISYRASRPIDDVRVSSVVISSRECIPSSIFIALAGNMVDGHTFIADAISRGATVIVHEHDLPSYDDSVVYVKVADSHASAGYIAQAFYGHPTEKMRVIGVTGTNGKTTIVTLLYQLFRMLGYRVGMMGTVSNMIHDQVYEAVRTTPDPITLASLLSRMVEDGCTHCFMEVSSHAVSEKRISGMKFAGGVFTNLTRDHLDYHHTFEAYRDAKKSFFDMLPEGAFVLSNKDDSNGEYMLAGTKAHKHFYAIRNQAEFTQKLETKLIGEFNAYNTLALYATAVLLDEDGEKIKEIIKNLEPVRGRFEYVKSTNGILGIVDYAHTPDALENVLRTIGGMKENGKVISVFGCGGDRDKGKRPLMARIGYEMSDIVIFTSDNPRSETVESILEDMKKGIVGLPEDTVHVISDRRDAIRFACARAQTGDYILVAGKGHETYQDIQGVKTHFDDREELQNCFILSGK